IGAALARQIAVSLALWLAVAVGAGAVFAKLKTELVAAPVLSHRLSASVEGRVESVERRGQGARIVLGDLHIPRLPKDAVPRRVRIPLRTATEDLAPGNWVQVSASLMPPPGPAAPGAYDFGRAAYFDGIGAVGFAYGRAHAIAPLDEAGPLQRVSAGIE